VAVKAMPADPRAVSRRFEIPGRLVRVVPLRRGHINDTYVAEYEQSSRVAHYLHQRLNRRVLADPELVMANVERVLAHLHAKLGEQATRHALTLVPARDGRSWVVDDDGEVWRTYLFLDDTCARDTTADVAELSAAGRAFGSFERLLADLPPPPLAVTIPHFHDTPRYFAAFARTVDADPCNRAAGARGEIAALLRRQPLSGALAERVALRGIPERTVHNDTKLDNVLFDAATGAALCVVDLDTVMPGLSLHDFGDLARSAASRAAEDARDLSRAGVDPGRFEAVARGFLAGAGELLTAAERSSLVLSARVITLELALRFLADHLSGDTYFRATHSGHNLERARAQLALLRSFEEQEEALERIGEGIERG
jgi:hypothetical protein